MRWPEEVARREQLADARLPRLLLVDPGEPPPDTDVLLEDWVRMPVDDDEVEARRRALGRRADEHGHDPAARPPRPPTAPVLDEHGVLQRGDRSVILAPIEALLTRALLQRLGAVVGRDALLRSAWPDGAPASNTLDVRLVRLRRRLAPLGLVILTVRKRGYLLQLAPWDGARQP